MTRMLDVVANDTVAPGSDLNFAGFSRPARSTNRPPSTNVASSPSHTVRVARLQVPPGSANRSRKCQDPTARSQHGVFHHRWEVDGSGPQPRAILFHWLVANHHGQTHSEGLLAGVFKGDVCVHAQ